MPGFIDNVEEIRARAAQKIEEGPVTETYEGDVDQTISILNEALATEIVCVLRYMHHYFMATGVHAMSVRDEFKEHADQIAERIQQLGGKPDFNPASLLQRSASQYAEGKSLSDMIKEDLIAERIVIEVYQKMIRHFGDKDPTTRVMIEGILRDEEEHAADLADLLFITDPSTGETEGEDPGTHPLDLHRDERSRQQSKGKSPSGTQPAERRSVGAAAADQGSAGQKRSHHRELDIPATPRSGGGEKQPQEADASGTADEEGVGNLISGDKTRLDSSRLASDRAPASQSADDVEDDEPVLHGHPMNRRKTGVKAVDGELDTGNPGSMSGTNRSVKVTNKKRKKNVA